MTPEVALMAIVKASDDSEAVNVSRMLGSVNGYVDAIYLQLNAPKGTPINKKIRTICEQFTDNIYVYEWDNNFVNARNSLMNKIPKRCDWVIWLDTDDIVDNPENIKRSLAVMPEDVPGVFILYDYQKDDYGNVIVSHWNTRAVRNNGTYAWKSSFDDGEVAVHETLIAKRGVRQVANNEWKVIHQATEEHLRKSLVRNIQLLEGMAQRQAKSEKGIDPRILFYLGSHYYDAHDYQKSREYFITYLERSGWPEERAEAHIYMGKLFLMHKDERRAKQAFLNAIGEYHDNPGAYLGLGKLESKMERWEQASQWFKDGISIKRKRTSMVRYNYDWELYTSLANALANLGGKNLPEALKMAEKALKLRPFDPNSKENRDSILRLLDYRDNMRAVARLVRKFQADKEEDKILGFLNQLPTEFEDTPVVVDAKQTYSPKKKWPKKSIAIYVGQGPLGIWGPWSLDDGGIGGSEEAVVRLSEELVSLGWEVTVFAMPGKRAGYFGSTWKNYWEFNAKDEFDVLVCWRQPAFFDLKLNARRKYLWLHDVTEKDELTPERLKNIDKIIYVSKYHSERPENIDVPQEKKMPSGNGIMPADFDKLDGKFKRDLHRCIYMSANERGLRILLDVWPDVLKKVPDATLTPYYGWQSFDAVNRDNPERMTWKALMIKQSEELGVPQSERLGHSDINKEIFKSGVFAYPCIFPEVYAISFIKAVAGGAHAVTSDFAVLKDYSDISDQAHLGEDIEKFKEEYKKLLIKSLLNPLSETERQRRAKIAREKYSWSNTAKQWDAEFQKGLK